MGEGELSMYLLHHLDWKSQMLSMDFRKLPSFYPETLLIHPNLKVYPS